MEFIKHNGKYLVKGSNGIIVDEKEKLQLENEELIIKDMTGCGCQEETTKKIAKNNKRIKDIMQEEKEFIQVETYDEKTALQNKENADDTIKKTNKSI